MSKTATKRSDLRQIVASGFRMVGRRAGIWLLIGSFAAVGLTGIEMALAGSIQLFLKSLGLLTADVEGFRLLAGINPTPVQLGFLLIAIGVVRAVGQILVTISSVSSANFINARLRLLTLYEMLLKPRGSYVSVSQVNLRISELFPKVMIFSKQITAALFSAIQCVGICIFMAITDWRATLVGVFCVGILGVSVKFLSRRIVILSQDIPLQQATLVSGIERVSKNWLLVRVLRSGRHEYHHLAQAVLKYAANSIRAKIYTRVSGALPPLIGIALIMFLVIMSRNYWGTPPVLIIGFLYLFLRFLQQLSQAFQSFNGAMNGLPHFLEVIKFFDGFKAAAVAPSLSAVDSVTFTGHLARDELGQSLPGASQHPPRRMDSASPPSIEINDVSFSYANHGPEVVSDLSLRIAAGSQFGIVGRSGSGKSTMLALILGVIDPDKGRVTIDGQDPDTYIKSPGVRIGYVGAEPFLIQGSIRDNMRYGLHDERSDAEYVDALKKARLYDAILEKPGQLEFQLNENGDGLSAGQKQRLSLARAFLSHPGLLVLDEVSANLDTQTESDIAETIKQLKVNITVLIVSHRKGILKYADALFSLD